MQAKISHKRVSQYYLMPSYSHRCYFKNHQKTQNTVVIRGTF